MEEEQPLADREIRLIDYIEFSKTVGFKKNKRYIYEGFCSGKEIGNRESFWTQVWM